MHTRTFFRLFLLLLLAGAPRADVLVGRVVGPDGKGVPGVNLDAVDLATGKEATLTNDGTDATGSFRTTLPAGVYRLELRAPPPPASLLLGLTLPSVVVAGTRDLGTLALAAGVQLSGRVLDPSGRPVAGLNLDVIERASGLELAIPGDRTNSFGQFALVVPPAALELRLRGEALDPPLAPRALEVTPLASSVLPDVRLAQGFWLEGRIERTNGQPLAGVDLDLLESATGAKLYTPRDDTNGAGEFAVVVPAGLFELELDPRLADRVAARRLVALAIDADTDLGVLELADGVLLEGRVSDASGAPAAGVDLDARAQGLSFFLGDDNTDALGFYAVVVEPGLYDLTFTPAGAACAVPARRFGLDVRGPTVLDVALPDPRASAAAFAGDGLNVDVLTPMPVVIGTSWSAPLTLGHAHGSGGTLLLRLRTSTVNGANLVSPFGGRPVEVLISGPTLLVMGGRHDGIAGGIAPLPVPADPALLGFPWAAQYTVVGGGHADLSTAAFGRVGCR